VPGDPEQVHAPCLEFNDEPDVQAAQREYAVDMEEIGGQECRGVGAQEDLPGSVVPGWWRDTVSAQDLPDGGGGHPVPQPP
jgi:hypothetical protein